jgi:hypothetical protein
MTIAMIDALLEASPKPDRAALKQAPKKAVLKRAKRSFKQSAWLATPLRTSAEAAFSALAAE